MFLAAIASVWLIMVVVTNPAGNFPLNDDWTYARNVRHLVEHGHLQLWRGAFAMSIGNLPWGALFCLPFGFSFVALRASSLVLGLIGVFSVYGLLREAGAKPSVAGIAGLSLAVNPVYYSLSYTYMTDVPCAAYSALAAYCFARALRTQSGWAILFGTLASCAAAATRQFGLLVPVAFLAAQIFRAGFKLRPVVRGLLPLVVVVLVLAVCPGAVISPSKMLSGNGGGLNTLGGYLSGFGLECLKSLPYLGLYALPMVVIMPWWRRLRGWRTEQIGIAKVYTVLLSVAFVAALAAAGILLGDKVMVPTGGNIIYNCGLGPATLKDTYCLGMRDSIPVAGPGFWTVVSVIGFVSGAILVMLLARMVWETLRSLRDQTDRNERSISLLCLTAFVMLIIPICFTASLTTLLDRYILIAIPFLLVIPLVVGGRGFRPARIQLALATIALLLIAGFSVAGTHDYLSWNRARWKALDSLTRKDKIDPKDIDGGYEFNGWYTWPNTWVPQFGSSKSWWVLYDDEYVVSFGRMFGVLDLRRYPFERWMPVRRTDYIHVGKAVDLWVTPQGAHWVLRNNPFIEKAVVCESFDARLGMPMGVASSFRAGTESITIAFKTKYGEGKVDIQMPTYLNGRKTGMGRAQARLGSVAYGSFGQQGGVPSGSYRCVIVANGMNVGEMSFTVE
jgi:4-amino-4-deoxy-L-arabinose transferase-like glycosyltransferase